MPQLELHEALASSIEDLSQASLSLASYVDRLGLPPLVRSALLSKINAKCSAYYRLGRRYEAVSGDFHGAE